MLGNRFNGASHMQGENLAVWNNMSLCFLSWDNLSVPNRAQESLTAAADAY